MTAVPHIKGLAFRGMLDSLKRLKGDEAVRRTVDRLPADLAKTARAELFVTHAWYPLSDYAQLLRAMMEANRGGIELICALSREATLQDFRGIYRILVAIVSPSFLMKRVPMLFNRYYDTGRVVIEATPGTATARYEGCKGFDHLLWNDSIYGSKAVLEACGAKDIDFRILAGGNDGDDDCTVHFSWR
jgi:hypothetical protein